MLNRGHRDGLSSCRLGCRLGSRFGCSFGCRPFWTRFCSVGSRLGSRLGRGFQPLWQVFWLRNVTREIQFPIGKNICQSPYSTRTLCPHNLMGLQGAEFRALRHIECIKLKIKNSWFTAMHKCYYLVQPTDMREKLNIELFCKFGKVKVTVPSPPPPPSHLLYKGGSCTRGGGYNCVQSDCHAKKHIRKINKGRSV